MCAFSDSLNAERNMISYDDLRFRRISKSFLSPSVWELLCLSRDEQEEDILTPDGFLDWKAIDAILQSTDYTKETVDFKNIIVKLAPCLTHVFMVYREISQQEFWATYKSYFTWTHNEDIFRHSFELLKDDEHDSSVILATQLLIAMLERALGNVYLLKGKNVPYLMKDLISTCELKEILGVNEMAIINVFLGTPASLNLRNILWHGFVSPGEIDQRYGYFLLILIMSLGLKLHNCGIDTIPHRADMTFDGTDILKTTFLDVCEEELHHLYDIFCNSWLIYPCSRPLWHSLLLKYKEERYGEAVALLIPQLENCLRVIFACVNNCSQRVLTAEPTARYVTFTEMFNNLLDDGSPNCFSTVLTESEMELLLDILVYPEGPRVRDRLSHGEVNIYQIPKHLVKHVLCVAAVFCLKFIPNEKHVKQLDFIVQLQRSASSYQSFYHPSAFLKRKVVHFISTLRTWDSCPTHVPEIVDIDEKPPLDLVNQCITLIHTIYEVPVTWSVSFSDDFVDYDLLLTNLRVLTIYRPKIEGEVITILRKISHHSIETSENVKVALISFNTSWKAKTLRSRQRVTYSRLLRSVTLLYVGLRLILVIIIGYMLQINKLSVWTFQEQNISFKILKLLLKHVENLAVMTGEKINKWEESMHCTSDVVTKLQGLLDALKHQKLS